MPITLSKRLKNYINIIISYIYRNKYVRNELNKYDDIKINNDAWYSKYSVIAHSGGGIDNHKQTNSKEAWRHAYDNGTRIFDADLSFTSDGIIVLRHEWSDDLQQGNISEDRIPNYEEFMHTPIFHKYQPVSIFDVIDFMKKNADVFVACDFKDGIEILEKLIATFKKNDCLNLFDRIIVSLYDYEDYYQAKKLYNFKNYAIRQYEEIPHNYYELCEFCLKERIPICMVTRNYIKEKDRIHILTKRGISIFVATVNDINQYKRYKTKGVSGIVSDWLTQDLLSRE